VNPYNNLMNPAGIGQAFQQSFQQGRQQRRERETDNALAQYALNPGAEEALAGVIKADPRLGIQLQQNHQRQQMAALEQHRESIVKGAQIFRQLGVKDEAGYQQALQVARQAGIDLRDVPPNFDPQYVSGVVAIADAFEPQKQNSAPASVQEYEFAKQQGFGGSYMDFMEEKRGPIVAANGDGTFQIIPRGMVQQQPQQGPQVGAVEDGYRFKGGNPADPNAWEPVNGGPTPQASGGFPGN
jgi:hypothetical protein